MGTFANAIRDALTLISVVGVSGVAFALIWNEVVLNDKRV